MMKSRINQVLEHKGREVHGVLCGSCVSDAVAAMAERRIGAVLVWRDEDVVGILTERDLARRLVFGRLDAQKTRVEDIMTSPLAYVEPDTTVDDAMKIMSETHCRHLPVLSEGKVVGLVSLGDLIRWQTADLDAHVHYLESYIRGR
jgi:signal-transduction protein with cAMP-binding, CBS, and nucleotidyltransferase domain